MVSRTPPALLAFDDEHRLAEALARELGWPMQAIRRHCFPDGESRLTLPAHLPARVVVLRGLQRPNDKLVELLLAAPAARELGARELTLVAPYLAYMRQDTAFSPGEVVSQRHVGRLLAHAFDAVVTIDPHLHRVHSLDEVLPGRRGIALSAAPLLGAWIARHVERAMLVGPDDESAQWVEHAARTAGMDWVVGRKQRRGDRDVVVELPAVDWRGRATVLIDDVASTGRTLAAAATQLLAAGAASVDVAVTHALFVDDALAQLRAAGVRHVWSSDAVPHETNAVTVAPLLAQALERR